MKSFPMCRELQEMIAGEGRPKRAGLCPCLKSPLSLIACSRRLELDLTYYITAPSLSFDFRPTLEDPSPFSDDTHQPHLVTIPRDNRRIIPTTESAQRTYYPG